MSRFTLGLDLGQMADFSALAIVERVNSIVPGQPSDYQVRDLRRWPLHTSYPAIVADVCDIASTPVLAGARLVFDAGGVGVAVADLLRQARLNPIAVTIHGGDTASREGNNHRVPKRDLIAGCQVLLQRQQLKISATLPEATTLVAELRDYRVKISEATGHDSYDARSGKHDDLVLALCLACWLASQTPRPFATAVGGRQTAFGGLISHGGTPKRPILERPGLLDPYGWRR